jgi:hypothetical protein
MDNDSIWLVRGGFVEDNSNNIQNNHTARAPLILARPHPQRLGLYVVPQPLRLVNAGGHIEPMLLDEGLKQHFRIPAGSRGVAVVLEARAPLERIRGSNGYPHHGTLKIIDNIGNVVREDITMNFVEITEGNRAGTVVGYALWDGKNERGRVVGAAAYLALIEVSVKFYDSENPQVFRLRQLISVTAARTLRED